MTKRVLVVGDIMLDRYTHVQTSRQAPEAPIPVWDIVREESRLGGAANVAHNLKALGTDEVHVLLAGIAQVGAGKEIQTLLRENLIDRSLIGGHSTMVKHRYVDEGRIIFRCDNFKRFDAHTVSYYEQFLPLMLDDMPPFDLIVVSDYDKGTVTRPIMEDLFSLRVPVVVDSKRPDLSMFEGMEVLKLNHAEYERQVSGAPGYINPERLAKHTVVTKGSAGAELRQNDVVKTSGNRYVTHVEQFPIESVDPVDVTGCGDTHTAAMAFSLLRDPTDVRRAVRFANACAASVVRKFGTSVVTVPHVVL